MRVFVIWVVMRTVWIIKNLPNWLFFARKIRNTRLWDKDRAAFVLCVFSTSSLLLGRVFISRASFREYHIQMARQIKHILFHFNDPTAYSKLKGCVNKIYDEHLTNSPGYWDDKILLIPRFWPKMRFKRNDKWTAN
jgi:hypothetical protein